ncbi:MAG: UvrD-helicase domain-containing protein [Acidimicrobiales bacterium]|nr:UvrD-helicase domain-containing protein [Acidimicrobiales bacterium]
MFADGPNVGILAAAGSRKTQQIIDTALELDGRVLITTYTNENLNQIRRRIEEVCGTVPPNIDLMGWFSFLIAHGAKPYQSAVTGRVNALSGLNFDGDHLPFTKKDTGEQYFVDGEGNLYRKYLADFVVTADVATQGAVARRLSGIYSAVFVDELQDLAGWDLEVLDMLLGADTNVLLVGDPRQHTYATYPANKNKKYRGMGMVTWLDERDDVCHRLDRTESFRCHQSICDYADSLYPDMPQTTSVGIDDTGHDGVVTVPESEVHSYFEEHRPVVLRPRRDRDTLGLPAINIGVSKGSTFDRVLIFPTNPMKEFVETGDLTKLKPAARSSLYVAVTRARHSVAVVM